MPNLIETRGLSFQYGKTPILEDIDLKVPAHSIYGFLGPNGAGKSTTIKVLLGLLRTAPGTVSLFGRDITRDRRHILARTGNLIESPSVYGHLTAWDNLAYLHTLFPGGNRKQRIEEVLELVGLQDAARKKVKQFSMGMKQRLGIAMALFHDPDLLVLDEPVNGLDPSGIHEMRQLFLRLREKGKTLFISSHLLSEIEKTCTHLGIINRGRLIFQGEMQELLATTRRRVHLKTSEPQRAAEVLAGKGWQYHINGDHATVDVEQDEVFDEMLRVLVDARVPILDVEREAPSLESLFIDLTKN